MARVLVYGRSMKCLCGWRNPRPPLLWARHGFCARRREYIFGKDDDRTRLGRDLPVGKAAGLITLLLFLLSLRSLILSHGIHEK